MENNRRIWPRLNCRLDVKINPLLNATESHKPMATEMLVGASTLSKNFSVRGLCLKGKWESITKEDRLYLSIKTPTEQFPIELESKVAWQSYDEMGVEFVGINAFDEVRLEQCFEFFKDIYTL
ncbi:MAG: PilZ domain-containing protein [Pseudomonadota bacterium]